ncbi:MAG TPA: hypothetical protein VET48_14170, partial [Steroidobacteraceae bacterium]|nr:hypothetical protein [Steroidobacteraceae bacterium]
MTAAEKLILTARDGGNTGNAGAVLSTPNAQNKYEVTSADLPLSCPMPSMQLWNSHPKVYLPI